MIKRLVFCMFVLALPAYAQQWITPVALPLYAPIHCSKQTGCLYSVIAQAGRTGIIVARGASPQASISDSLGNTWSTDQCVPYTGMCSFHAIFGANPNNAPDVITFIGDGTFNDVYLLVYSGLWIFDSGQYGTYDTLNYPFSECANGGRCTYNWTLPVDAEAGSLLIAFSDYNDAGGLALPQAGMGYTIEATDGSLAVEDMITPVTGVYIGAMYWKTFPNASVIGGSHWLMGLAEYKRATP